MTPFLPPDFAVPVEYRADSFRLRPLTVHDVVKDYEAVVTSRERLRGLFGPDDPWPAEDLSLTQDLIDLGWHQREFQLRRSFAYTVVDHDDRRCLGCVYIEPSDKLGYDARVFYWIRSLANADRLEAELGQAIDRWLADAWCFRTVAFPGREIGWPEWAALAPG